MVFGSVTVKHIQNLDALAIDGVGVPSVALMENAGRAVACEAVKGLKRTDKPVVSVVCGLGNNAGDGFVAARHLLNAGIRTRVFLIGTIQRLKTDALTNCRVLVKAGYPVKEVSRADAAFVRAMKAGDVLVDAVFGVGLNREITEPFSSVICAMNEARRPVIAVDIPSGLDGTTGRVHGVCIKARKTVTFTFAKRGFFRREGPRVCGKIIVADIGIPRKLWSIRQISTKSSSV